MQTFESWMEECFIVSNPELRKEDFNAFRDRLIIDFVYAMAELYGLYCFRKGTDAVKKLVEEQLNK